MNAIWTKHRVKIIAVVLILPFVLLLWGVRTDNPPLGGLGFGLVALAVYCVKKRWQVPS